MQSISKLDRCADRSVMPSPAICLPRISGDISIDDVPSNTNCTTTQDVYILPWGKTDSLAEDPANLLIMQAKNTLYPITFCDIRLTILVYTLLIKLLIIYC